MLCTVTEERGVWITALGKPSDAFATSPLPHLSHSSPLMSPIQFSATLHKQLLFIYNTSAHVALLVVGVKPSHQATPKSLHYLHLGEGRVRGEDKKARFIA